MQILGQSRRKLLLAVAIGGLLLVAATYGLIFAVARGAGGLGGTDVTELDLPRERQIDLINAFSPRPIPSDATDIRLRYQRFQDWRFEASLTLRPDQLEALVAGLEPAGSPGTYVGKQIGPHVGTVRVDRASGRVVVLHVSS